MLIRILAPIAVVTLCAASVTQIVRPTVPRVLYNPSPSAPIGWYRLRPNVIANRDDLVAAYAPKNGAVIAVERGYLPQNIPLIKTVWAVSVLVSTDVQTSFDSRYFGPVKREALLGRVEYLGQLQSRSERRKAGRG